MTSLAIKHRPESLKDIRGNETLVDVIESKVTGKRKPQTYILKGPRGCGKTTIGRIMGGMLGAKGRDLKELNIADMRGIDSAREIIENIGYAAMDSKSKVVVLNEVHMATKEFENAMLEKLEEPPANTFFILCTTDPQQLLPTVLSRCALKSLSVKPLKLKEMQVLLADILKKEKVKWDKKQITTVAEIADGIPREALMLLDDLIDLKKKKLQKALDELEYITKDVPIKIARALNTGANWKEVKLILDDVRSEPSEAEGIRRMILSYMWKVLLDKGDPRSAMVVEMFEDNFYDSGFAGLVLACWKATNYK